MKLSWLGHASFLLETNQGTKIITDPYESGGYDGAVAYGPIDLEADIVTVSHQHADHNHIQPFKMAKIVDKAETFNFKDVKIEGLNSYHDAKGGKLRGENIIFTIAVEGLKVVHFGDLGTEDIEYFKFQNIDIVLIPVGGTFTLDSEAASRVIDKINPKVTIPMHFKTSKLEFDIDRVDEFLKGKEYEKKDVLEVNSQSVGLFKKFVLLNHQR
ncbi:MAG: MBL fold metallo-hydrolase [Candidatus Omnitrophica bacterium]|nr:MBL fold metallo-hydrolase [Candidatus Omnitrophota bacterium]